MDLERIRKEFSILDQVVNDEPLVYLDNAATTQKPQQVLDVLADYYQKDNANVHRGVHTLSERATTRYEAARQKVADFIQAKSSKEILFTRGTTTSLNWVAQFAKEILQPDQEVIISVQEHHSNIIPWQQACQQTGAKLRYVTLKDGELDMDHLRSLLSSKTKFVSLAHVIQCPRWRGSYWGNSRAGASSRCLLGGGRSPVSSPHGRQRARIRRGFLCLFRS